MGKRGDARGRGAGGDGAHRIGECRIEKGEVPVAMNDAAATDQPAGSGGTQEAGFNSSVR